MTERFGAWCLDALLAAGGVGEIWRSSRDRQDPARAVALKRLHTHLLRNPEVREQFRLEQTLATQLPRHPNLVHAEEAGEVEGRPYVALILAPGEDLRRQLQPPAIAGDGPGGHAEPRSGIGVSRASALAIAAAACDAASHLHEQGFVHGDINPGNLVVSRDGHVTLIDLGIARQIGQAGAVRGTHAYMAPEQVHGRAWTRATDVFALAVVLWELVAGRRLFHRGPPWLSMAAVVEDAAPPLDDPALEAIARAALAKDPARRIATASELAARLRDLA